MADMNNSAGFEIAPGRWVGEQFPCFIVAEIGQNHQGDLEIAKKLIHCAKECGVDCVKFQKTDIHSRFTQEVLLRPYINCNSWDKTYGKHREKIEFTEEEFFELSQYSSSLGIYFTASGMDKTYKEKFPKAVIGYSGHELGIEISVAAVAVGAKILERHITLDHSLKGSDHVASLEPSELKQLVSEVRRIECAMGSGKKCIQDAEKACIEKLGKTIVATRFLSCGTVIKEDMIDIKVAVNKGLNPINFYDLLGKTLKKDYETEESIMPEDLIDM